MRFVLSSAFDLAFWEMAGGGVVVVMQSISLDFAAKIEGGLYGLLIGDALGVPYEFHGPREIPAQGGIEFEPPAGFRRAHFSVPPGTWSDDGAQALCLLASLLASKRFDPEDFASRLVRWRREGYMAVDHHVFDVGITSQNAIAALQAGVAPLSAGLSGEFDNGNGSLMRVLPLALWHTGTDDELAHDAHDQSRITHAHPRSMVCCAVYCLWARNVLANASDPWNDAVLSLKRIYTGTTVMARELNVLLRAIKDEPPTGTGYVVDSLMSALSVQTHGSYESIVKAAVALGYDTDTTACIAGGVAGVAFGIGGIPARWREGLRGQELVRPLLDQLLEVRAQ